MGRLSEFVTQFWYAHEEETVFDIWLHKVDDKTFEEFKDLVMPKKIKPMTIDKVVDTVNESRIILDNFSPNRR